MLIFPPLGILSRFFLVAPVRVVVAGFGLLMLQGGALADVFSNVPEAADFNIAYELEIPTNAAYQGTTPVPYNVNSSATAAPGGFDRVAYYLELTNSAGTTWAYASMDAFTSLVTQTGLPHNIDNPVTFQRSVSNLTVLSNVAGVQAGSFDRGQIEMWHHNYSAPDQAPLPMIGGTRSGRPLPDTGVFRSTIPAAGRWCLLTTVGRMPLPMTI